MLKDVVEHHAEEEEEQLLPRARKLLGLEALKELGTRLAEFHRSGVVAKR